MRYIETNEAIKFYRTQSATVLVKLYSNEESGSGLFVVSEHHLCIHHKEIMTVRFYPNFH
jgi:hypothetical protein